MTVYFVGSGPGDPELLTRKALRILQSARICIHAGSLVDPEILKELPDNCKLYDSAGMNLDEIIDVMVNAYNQGTDVVRLHSGEPALYGAIGEQMRRLDLLNIPYQVIPGISSFQAAAASLCLELTSPEVAQTVVLTRSPGRTPMPGEELWLDQFHPYATYCIFLSVDKLASLAGSIAQKMGDSCPCAVVFHASRPDQKILRGTLQTIGAQVQQAGISSTAQIIIGYALNATPVSAESKLYNRNFNHGFRGSKQ